MPPLGVSFPIYVGCSILPAFTLSPRSFAVGSALWQGVADDAIEFHHSAPPTDQVQGLRRVTGYASRRVWKLASLLGFATCQARTKTACSSSLWLRLDVGGLECLRSRHVTYASDGQHAKRVYAAGRCSGCVHDVQAPMNRAKAKPEKRVLGRVPLLRV